VNFAIYGTKNILEILFYYFSNMSELVVFANLPMVIFYFALSFILWAFVGIQKDIPSDKKSWFLTSKKEILNNFSWIRSYGLIALFWALSQYLDQIFTTYLIVTVFWFILMSVFIVIDYIYNVYKRESHSPASEISTILVYFIWVLVFLWAKEVAIILAIALSLIIASKDIIHSYVLKISREEVDTTLKFAAIAFVILPLLPDVKYSFLSLFESLWFAGASAITHPIWTTTFFNPYSLWLFVVVMSAISYIWYFLTKIFGSTSGILLSSLMWWLVSSTAVTASMSEESKKYPKNSSLYTTGTLLASAVMFLRVIAIVGFVYVSLLSFIFIPALVMFVIFIACTGYFYYTSKQQKQEKLSIEEKVQSPFQIAPALKFAWFILIIKFIAAIGIIYKDVWGEGLFYYTLGIISGLADVDAITQTMASDAGSGSIGIVVAGTTILIAVMSNNLVKWTLAYRFGETQFWRKVLFSFVASALWGIVTLFLL